MSDPKKGHPQEEIIDFGDFSGSSAPPPPEAGDPFPFEDAPQPASARPAPPISRRDDYADLGRTHPEEDDDPFLSTPAAPAERREIFGDEDEQEREPVAPSRLRRSEPAFHSDDEAAFEPDPEDRPADRRAAAHHEDEAEGDGYTFDEAQDGLDDQSEEAEEAPAKEKRNLSGLLIYAIGGVIAVVVGWIGYSTVLSPLMGWNAPTQVAQPMSPVGGGQRPAQPSNGTLPPLGGNAPSLPPRTLQPGTPAPVPPAQTQVAQPQPGAIPPPVQVPTATNPQQPPVQRPPAVATTPVTAAVADKAVTDRLAKVEDRVAGLVTREDYEARIKALEDRLRALDNRSMPTAPRPEVQVPVKPAIIDGWTLQGVNRDKAWLKGPGGIVEAQEDTELGGKAGRVTRIQRYNNNWIVVTTTGVIMRN